jgi:streptogramin lyase
MNQDFVTQLRLQLREAALRDERRTPAARRLVDARLRAPRPAVLAAGIAVALLALAAALGALSLRGEPEPTTPKVIHTFKVASGLTSITQGFGAVWATDLSSGNVLRIDPKTRKVVARIPVVGGVGGISPDILVAAGRGTVWVLAGDLQNGGVEGPVRLMRIDPRRNRVVAGIPLTKPSGGTFSPQGVHVGDGVVWVIGTAGALQIDPASNTPQRYVPIGGAARGVVAAGDAVWLLGLNGRLRQVDARTGRTVRTVRVPVTTGTFLAGGALGPLMLVDHGHLTAFDPTNGRVLWRAAFESPLRSLAAGRDDTLWAFLDRTPERRDRLVRIDAGTGRRTGQVEVSEPGNAGLAQVGRELWVAHPNGRITVVR